MGEDLIPVQYGRLQFIFQGQYSATDQLAALRQVCSRAAPILARKRKTMAVNKRKRRLKQQWFKYMGLVLRRIKHKSV